MIMFFDTETTGFPQAGVPLSHESQPHLVQLACILTEDDGTERASVSLIVDSGVPIPSAPASIHGITDAIARRCGVAPRAALTVWHGLAFRADMIVAHNIDFDWQIMAISWSRLFSAQASFEEVHGKRARYCTMKSACPVVNLPPTERMVAAGRMGPKSPRLAECVRFLFQEDLEGAHDALVDVRACARIYFKLREMRTAA